MRRNPADHVPYSNRAACYQKLMEWVLALKDCEKCIQMAPTFVKVWNRKGGTCLLRARGRPSRRGARARRQLGPRARPCAHAHAPRRAVRTAASTSAVLAGLHFHLKEYHKALDAYQQALKLDENSAEAKDGVERTIVAINMGSNDEDQQARAQRAMADPEIQAILQDGTMRNVLSEMQSDPKSANKFMSDPSIKKNIEKLIAAGVLAIK